MGSCEMIAKEESNPCLSEFIHYNFIELIGKTVSLKKQGENHLGLCPFHSEKTPSFTVNERLKRFHCFGCKESGNGFDFFHKLSKIEGDLVSDVLTEKWVNDALYEAGYPEGRD